MKLSLIQVDAFTSQVFGGNPAAVVPLQEWLPDEVMQNIAMENQLSETAYFVPEKNGFRLRWFTPVVEVDLCGHATLASAHVIFTELGWDRKDVEFESRSGSLTVSQTESGYAMDFPVDRIETDQESKQAVEGALGATVLELYRGKEDLLAVMESEATVAALHPDMRKIEEIGIRGILATAPGNEVDFVSRCFFPLFGIDEDPVTGSAHTTMTPYWAGKLGRNQLSARQISRRGGALNCCLRGERVEIGGEAVTYLRGEIEI